MKVRRILPPAAAPLGWSDLWNGFVGLPSGQRSQRRLEDEIKGYFGVDHVFLVSSGKAALALILLGLKSLSQRKEVLIPAYTCFSVPSSILKSGLKVTLCDIDPKTFGFDFHVLDAAITGETLCIIPTHLFGIPEAMDEIKALGEKRGVCVVEDAAQAMGGTYRGRKLGTIGDVGFFSFGRGKNITCGSGGAIITRSDPIAKAIAAHYSSLEKPGTGESLREFLELFFMMVFIHPWFYWLPSGMQSLKLGQTIFYKDFPVKKFSGMKAGFLRNWRDRLEQAGLGRAKTSKHFVEQVRMEGMPRQALPYPRLPIRVEDQETRDRIYSLGQERGLGVGLMYPSSINEIEEIRAAFNGQSFPRASNLARELLTIPTHHLVSESDREAIIALLNEAARVERNDASDKEQRIRVGS